MIHIPFNKLILLKKIKNCYTSMIYGLLFFWGLHMLLSCKMKVYEIIPNIITSLILLKGVKFNGGT